MWPPNGSTTVAPSKLTGLAPRCRLKLVAERRNRQSWVVVAMAVAQRLVGILPAVV